MAESVDVVINAAEDRLRTARFGLQDMQQPQKASSGLYNAVVFGRMVTFALQNLRNIVPDFDAWYEPKRQAMKSDELMAYFSDLRTKIEKKADSSIGNAMIVHSFGPAEMKQFEPAPPGATGFVVGDQYGGSGWRVKGADGTEEMYYVDLPNEIAQSFILLDGLPAQFQQLSTLQLVGQYLDKLANLINEAKAQFAKR